MNYFTLPYLVRFIYKNPRAELFHIKMCIKCHWKSCQNILLINSVALKTGGSMPHSQGLSNRPMLSQINLINTYLFKIYSNVVLSSPSGPSWRSIPCRFTSCDFESTPIFHHSGCMTCPSQSPRFNHPDYIRWTVQTMRFLIVEPSPLPILIPLKRRKAKSWLSSNLRWH